MSTASNSGGSPPLRPRPQLASRPGPLDQPRRGLGGKSIWDWVNLSSKLAIPIAVGVTTIAFGWWQAHLADLQHSSNSSKSSNTSLSWLAPFLLWFGIAVIVLAVVSTSITTLRSWRRRSALRARVERLKARSYEDDCEVGPVEIEVHRLAGYRDQRDAAEKELASYLPANPRRAKRLINHERLYGRIAEERRIFGGLPELTYHHLTKWVLIVENWPRLGAALTRDPSVMEQLEQPTSVGELQDVLNDTIPGVSATDDLVDILHKGVQLSPVITRLVRFEPALSDAKGLLGPRVEGVELH